MPESVTDRPTRSHEYLFLFAKQSRYFYDADAVREPTSRPTSGNLERTPGSQRQAADGLGDVAASVPWVNTGAGRNLRSVWDIPSQPTPEAHFATYPPELVRRCIAAGTSEHGGCSSCGRAWQRVVERTPYQPPSAAPGERFVDASRQDADRKLSGAAYNQQVRTRLLGWAAGCDCDAPPTSQLVLDPFIGSGTTALVARRLGRRCIGIDLSAEYLRIAERRTSQLSLLAVDLELEHER